MVDAAKRKVYPVHDNVSKFGTAGFESTDEQMVMPADLENFAPSIDGTVGEWYPVDAAGWAKAAMTDKKLKFSFEEKRSVEDPGSDYITGLTQEFRQDVMAKFERTMISGAKLACNVVINVMTPGGGDTTNTDSLRFEVMGCDKPVFTPA